MARSMYMEGTSEYKHHVEHYGHPSEVGFKDIIPLFKAEKWNPDELVAFYKKIGAQYFFALGNHHDNFDLWIVNINHGIQRTWVRNVISWQNGKKRHANTSFHLVSVSMLTMPGPGMNPPNVMTDTDLKPVSLTMAL